MHLTAKRMHPTCNLSLRKQERHVSTDAKYDVDVISSIFSLIEKYSWYQRNDGVVVMGIGDGNTGDPVRRSTGQLELQTTDLR